jgi:hypothetical protein
MNMIIVNNINKLIGISLMFFIACMISFSSAYADTLSQALAAWDPAVIHGRIMEVGSDYIIIQEKKVVILDTSISGKKIKTSITDGKGKVLEKQDLKKGILVFSKGSMSFDDKIKGDVLLATDIYVVPRLLKPEDANEYKGIMEPSKQW